MKKPHLFFIKIHTGFSIYYYSMKYDLEEVQSTTHGNIITIIKDVLKNDIKFTDSNITFDIEELKPDENKSYIIGDLNRWFRNFIYYDDIIREWVVSYKNEPDYKIPNCINDNASLKLILIGSYSYFNNIMKNEESRLNMFKLFGRFYHIKASDALIHTIQTENDISSITDMCDCLPDTNNKNFAIILQDGYKLSTIKKISEYCRNKSNVEVFVLVQSEYYKVTTTSAEITFKKVCLR